MARRKAGIRMRTETFNSPIQTVLTTLTTRYLTRRAYWLPEFGGAAVTPFHPGSGGIHNLGSPALPESPQRKAASTLWTEIAKPACSIASKARPPKSSAITAQSMASCCHLRRKSHAGSEMLTVLYTQRTLRQDPRYDRVSPFPFARITRCRLRARWSRGRRGWTHLFKPRSTAKGPFKAVFDTGVCEHPLRRTWPVAGS